MKYQHILNDEILIETDDLSEFMTYLINDDRAKLARFNILYNLLDKANGYICNMKSIK